MKKVYLGLFLLLAVAFYGCADEKNTMDREEAEEIAFNFVEDSDEFIDNVGFDVTLKEGTTLPNCFNCFEFEYSFSVLGDTIGYDMIVSVKDGTASFKEGPTPIN